MTLGSLLFLICSKSAITCKIVRSANLFISECSSACNRFTLPSIFSVFFAAARTFFNLLITDSLETIVAASHYRARVAICVSRLHLAAVVSIGAEWSVFSESCAIAAPAWTTPEGADSKPR